MLKRLGVLHLFLATLFLCATGAAAQTNTYPWPASGNVGIGTTNPMYSLDASGNERVGGNLYFGNLTDPASITPTWADNLHTGMNFNYVNGGTYATGIALTWNGNVGIGTTSPNNLLELSGGALDFYNPGKWVAVGMDYDPTTDSLRLRSNNSSTNLNQTNVSIQRVSGYVGIGATNPQYNLDVAGQVHASTGYVFPDGTTQTTAFIPANCGADYAEAVDVSGDRTKYEPGDLLVIDPDNAGKFLKSNQAYSPMVAGVYSTKPGFVGRKHPADDKASADEVPMAMVGRVPTKVSAENGPIKVGDLLVTSSTMGYAMKGTDHTQMLGAVIGKALGSLNSGIGVIEVLVTLQ